MKSRALKTSYTASPPTRIFATYVGALNNLNATIIWKTRYVSNETC